MKSTLTALLLADAVEKYSPDQERDENGRWSGGGSSETKPAFQHEAGKVPAYAIREARQASRVADKESKRAFKASLRAKDAVSHNQAYNAHVNVEDLHRQAAVAARENRNSAQAKYHEGRMKVHGEYADKHLKAVQGV
jgi:hypothetical protein